MTESVNPPSPGSTPLLPLPTPMPKAKGKAGLREVEALESESQFSELQPKLEPEPETTALLNRKIDGQSFIKLRVSGAAENEEKEDVSCLDPENSSLENYEQDAEFFDALTELSSDEYSPEKIQVGHQEDNLEFHDALSEVYTEPDTVQQDSIPAAVPEPSSGQQPTSSKKSSRTERVFGALLAWGLNRGKVRSKFSTSSTQTIQNIKKQVKALTKHAAKTERSNSQEELRDLKQAKKKAYKSSKNEAVDYLKLLKAFKSIHAGKEQRHEVRMDSLSLANGQYNLVDVKLGVTKVNLVESEDGSIRPQITADIEGILEIPLPGQDPLRIKLDMKDFQISLEGRMVPAANAWIGSYGAKETLSQLKKITKDSGSLFNLRHVGVKAESIHATLLDPHPDTFAAFNKRIRSTKGRAFDRLFVSLGLPLDIEVDDLRINIKTGEQPTKRLFGITKFSSHYTPPRNKDRQTPQGRELSVHAKRIDIETEGLSEQLIDTAKLLATEKMVLLPGSSNSEESPLSALANQSTHLSGHVEDFSLNIGREVKHNRGRLELTGRDTTDLHTGPILLHNKGQSTFNIKADELILLAGRKGNKNTFSLSVAGSELKAGINQSLPKKSGNIQFKGEIEAKKINISGQLDKDIKEIEVSAEGVKLDTKNQQSQMTIGETQVTVPANLFANTNSLKFRASTANHSTQTKLTTEDLLLKGNGTVSVVTENHQLTIPVNGEIETKGNSTVEWHKTPDGTHGQSSNFLSVRPGTTLFRNVKVDQFELESGQLDLDENLTGELTLENIEFNGSQLLSDASPVPKWVRDKTPSSLLANRKLKLSLKLPLKEGRLDMSNAMIKGLSFDHQSADNNSWLGAGSKFVLDKASEHCYLEAVTVSKGRAWIKVNIAGYPIWLPTLKVPGHQEVDDNSVHLPELLHGLSGAHFSTLTDKENQLIVKAQEGGLESLYEMMDYCDSVDSEKSTLMLKKLDINLWLTANNMEALLLINTYFQKYPETAGKSLAISLMPGIPVDESVLKFFSQKEIRKKMDPGALAALHVKAKNYATAYDILEDASVKYPSSIRYLTSKAEIAELWLQSTHEGERTSELLAAFNKDITDALVQAANLGHLEAMVKLRKLAQQGNSLAKIGLAGLLMTNNKTSAGFYEAITVLEPLAGSIDEDTLPKKLAMDILQRRARNATRMFIHADESSDQLLVQEQLIIGKGKETELSSRKLYLWGLRYLYGVEGIKQNQEEAKRLLKLAADQGVESAKTHGLIALRMQETEV